MERSQLVQEGKCTWKDGTGGSLRETVGPNIQVIPGNQWNGQSSKLVKQQAFLRFFICQQSCSHLSENMIMLPVQGGIKEPSTLGDLLTEVLGARSSGILGIWHPG